MALIRGVDGCRAGWLYVSQDSNTDDISVDVFGSADALFGDTLAEVTAIDIPIALSTDRARACDREARGLLGPRLEAVCLRRPSMLPSTLIPTRLRAKPTRPLV